MAHESIRPNSAKALQEILTPLSANVGSVAALLDIPAATVTRIQNCKLNVDWIIDVARVLKQEKEQTTKLKEGLLFGKLNMPLQPLMVTVPAAAPATLESGITDFIMGIIKSIKAHLSYTEEIGKLLGIIGAEKFINFTTVKSKVELAASKPEGIELSFSLMEAENIAIFRYIYDDSKPIPAKTDNVSWVKIAVVKHSPYVDNTPNIAHKPETRIYKTRLVVNDKFVGIESDVITVPATVYMDEDGSETTSVPK